MKYRELPNSNLRVSELCLGTMTYGEQNSAAEAHQQLDYALAHGINFIDRRTLLYGPGFVHAAEPDTSRPCQ